VVRTLYEYVAGLDNQPTFGTQGAVQCLREGGGDPGGQARLLVALCRNRGIPARLVHGLILTGNQEQGPHAWAEAWVNGYWLPACPWHHHFGEGKLPRNYLVLAVGDEEPVRGHNAQARYRFLVQALADPVQPSDGSVGGVLRSFYHRFSLYTLRPGEQHLVLFLLLLPPAALIVCCFRNLIGIPTFGTFTPALLGLAFLDWKVMPLGLGTIFLMVMIGWGLRRVLDGYHLLMVPRLAILLTLIVVSLIVFIVVAGRWGLPVTHYVSLFPLVILTHMVERFGTREVEDGTASSFHALLWTFAVAAAVSLALGPPAVGATLLAAPELLGAVLAALFLIGRYTGYRLTELYRFQDMIPDQQTPADAAGQTSQALQPVGPANQAAEGGS
jgi:hypothetical protein